MAHETASQVFLRSCMLATIEQAIEVLNSGKMIILVDDENRENEGDLFMLAQHVRPEDINFMVHKACGLICLTMTGERLRSLEIPPMVAHNTSRFHTGFHVSIEAAQGVTTGISAYDRAHTIRVAVSPDCTAASLARPGHIFPIAALPGGVLVRIGQTEGSIDLAKLCGAAIPSGVICEIMNDDGTMARMPDLEIFAQMYDLPIVTNAEIIAYRLRRETLIDKVHDSDLAAGIASGFHAIAFKSRIDGATHLALTYRLDQNKAPLVRVHGGSVWNDLLGLHDDDHALESALDQIRAWGCGALLYIQRESQTPSVDEAFSGVESASHDDIINRPPSEIRLYGIGAQCLHALGITDMILLTDTPKKLAALDGFGLRIIHTQPLHT